MSKSSTDIKTAASIGVNRSTARRHWSDADRARILSEALAPGAVVSAVARRYGLAPQQLFNWRREARKQANYETFSLMGAVVVPGPERMEPKELKPPEFNEYWGKAKLPTIELEVSGIKIRIDDGVSPATIVAVISALKKTV